MDCSPKLSTNTTLPRQQTYQVPAQTHPKRVSELFSILHRTIRPAIDFSLTAKARIASSSSDCRSISLHLLSAAGLFSPCTNFSALLFSNIPSLSSSAPRPPLLNHTTTTPPPHSTSTTLRAPHLQSNTSSARTLEVLEDNSLARAHLSAACTPLARVS